MSLRKEGYFMTETMARAKEGKKIRTLNDSYPVPRGTTGEVTNPRLGIGVSKFMSTGGNIPKPTEGEWAVDLKFDDPAKTVVPIIEWDGNSLQETN
jgi:hypothetical protein